MMWSKLIDFQGQKAYDKNGKVGSQVSCHRRSGISGEKYGIHSMCKEQALKNFHGLEKKMTRNRKTNKKTPNCLNKR